MVSICLLPDPALMTRSELDWLNSYHQLCRDRYLPIFQYTCNEAPRSIYSKQDFPISLRE
jgi:hypothetical protein